MRSLRDGERIVLAIIGSGGKRLMYQEPGTRSQIPGAK